MRKRNNKMVSCYRCGRDRFYIYKVDDSVDNDGLMTNFKIVFVCIRCGSVQTVEKDVDDDQIKMHAYKLKFPDTDGNEWKP